MNYAETKDKLSEIINARLVATGNERHPLEDATALLGGSLPLDSLELAVVVLEMTKMTSRDPFASGFIEFQTLGELARLYAD